MLARAGLARLGRLAVVTEVLDPLQMLPAPGQGALEGPARLQPAIGAAPIAGADGARVVMKPEAIAGMSDVAKRVLADAKIDLAKVEPTLAVEMLEEQMRTTSARLASVEVAGPGFLNVAFTPAFCTWNTSELT